MKWLTSRAEKNYVAQDFKEKEDTIKQRFRIFKTKFKEIVLICKNYSPRSSQYRNS
jgi:hypothetical protein